MARAMPKSKYESHVLPRLDEVEAWARDGISEKDIASNLHVADSTFRGYKSAYPALSAALAHGKDYVDNVVVTNAYLKRMIGYDATEVRREYKYETDPATGELHRTLVRETEQTRHIPGDPRAAEFWLTNRQRDRWKYKPEPGEGGDGETGVVLLEPAAAEPGPPAELVDEMAAKLSEQERLLDGMEAYRRE